MKTTKKLNFFISLLLLATTFNSYSMEPQQPSKWTATVRNVILGTAAMTILSQPNEPFEFTSLPPEMQYKIIQLLTTHTTATSLNEAAKTINSLAQVNHELNELINDPQFCLKIIKSLAKKFDCSDEVATMALQTQAAQKRINVQKLFEILFSEELFNEKEFNNFYEQYKNYVDLNFTYKFFDQADFKYTLLMCAAKRFETDGAAKIGWLLNTNMVNINCTDKFGTTTLMICTITADPETITLLCNYPTININQKNNYGETALMFMCVRSNSYLFKLANMKALLDAGADPEIADNVDGNSPLAMVEMFENQEAIDLIKEAIEKKHGKK